MTHVFDDTDSENLSVKQNMEANKKKEIDSGLRSLFEQAT